VPVCYGADSAESRCTAHEQGRTCDDQAPKTGAGRKRGVRCLPAHQAAAGNAQAVQAWRQAHVFTAHHRVFQAQLAQVPALLRCLTHPATSRCPTVVRTSGQLRLSTRVA